MTTASASPADDRGNEVEKTNGQRFTGWAANYIDERTSISGLVKELGRSSM